MQIHLKSKYMDDEVIVQRSKYFTGSLALISVMADGSGPAMAFSVNVQGVSETLPHDEFVLKDYGENEGVLKALEEAGVVKETGQIAEVGFVECPVVRLIDPERFENLHKG